MRLAGVLGREHRDLKIRLAGVCWFPEVDRMPRLRDIRSVLDNWPFDPADNVRVFTAKDGRPVMQVRTPLGVEQYELDGRPDGHRPHGAESLLEFHVARLARASSEGTADSFHLSQEECLDLFEEGVLYYCRYVHLLQVEEWERMVRDTARNLRLSQFVSRHAGRLEDRQHMEPWRPYLIRMNAVARAMVHLQRARHIQALAVVRAALADIAALPEVDVETFRIERERALDALRDMAEGIEHNRPLSEEERLENELRAAVSREEFERAAVLRDRIGALRARQQAARPATRGAASDRS
jgi:hypothetical protein